MQTPTLISQPSVSLRSARRQDEVLTSEALEFLAKLHANFEPRRRDLLETRKVRQAAIDAGQHPGFLPGTQDIRDATWRVLPPPADLVDRRVEITGPVDRKMMINALNSGAKVFMADFEDALSPTWDNVISGQANLQDAVRGKLSLEGPGGRRYEVGPAPATLVVRPRGLHLGEPRVQIEGDAMSASLFDFGLFAFHNAKHLLFHGSGPYLYLPKLESHLEARLWCDVFTFTEEELQVPPNSFRATVLIETLPAVFEMDEILYELRDRSPALNAGRWDYLFSTVKTLRNQPGFVLPDRADITMKTPFMWAYTQLLVQTCHRRGAYAIGGMAAYIPSRRDPERNDVALAKVREDKVREADEGFDGTWVAHPDLVPVAAGVFDARLGTRTNQVHEHRNGVTVGPADLLFHHLPSAAVTEAGVRSNVRVSLAYLANWLAGTGAVAIDSLMEDTATAEIARTQVWQWVRQGVVLENARTVNAELVRAMARDELARLRLDPEFPASARPHLGDARHLFEDVALADAFVDFLTIPGMTFLENLPGGSGGAPPGGAAA